jgi:hypothetical protein
VATWLAERYGLVAVGYYLCVTALITIVALLAMGRRGR